MARANGGKQGGGRISVQLLRILIPMIAAFIIMVALIIFVNSRSIIIEQGMSRLEEESKANANDIAGTMANIQGYYDGLSDLLESSTYSSNEEIKAALLPGMQKYPGMVNDVYIAFPDKTFIDGGDWVPDADYDPTTRGWYLEGSKHDSIIFGEPGIDMDTKEAVVNGIRKVDFADGRTGVISTDVFLKSISSEVGGYTPLGSGQSMLFAGPSIIGTPNPDYLGADASALTGDSFIQAIYSNVSAGKNGQVETIKGNDGKDYYVSFESVAGPEWTLVSYVKKDDVLKQLNRLSVITVILVVIMLAVSSFIILYLVRRMITEPVNNLTGTITRISEGDFTVSIKKGGNNEIGVMNNRMFDYVERMRNTLGEMKAVAQDLSHEADESMSTAESMSRQAGEQSDSMEQIRTAMEGVANSVTELATNATELAQSVSEMTEQGGTTRKIMEDLLVKARKGQEDMNSVQSNMDSISSSMNEMNSVVSAVDEAAQKINSIVEMINSISSQTNLLSLNASIEAARAGEAGRGFAVVASEIGNLANDSANATTEIGNIIKDITDLIERLSRRSESSMADIAASNEAVSETGKTFADIFEALDEAGSTVNDMVNRMDKVNDIATSVAAIAEEQSASTEEVTATVETASVTAQSVADESRTVDNTASTVAESSSRIGGFVDSFTI
ncbi:MAG: methyl-accepting chemotaxis protein [Lachnospiraceae bacterium]|nr:methyl-accepting chemotaxis protein [Lachnospiraceae bacterium]